MISKPMLACEYNSAKAKFPYLATPKIDGIRCLIINSQPVSRSLKPIRNKFIYESLCGLPEGFDGELTVGANFQDSTSGIMSVDGEPNFTYTVFDHVIDPAEPYESRVKRLASYVDRQFLPKFLSILEPSLITNETDLENYANWCFLRGFEGVILRSPESPYKFGRSTARENYLLKVKMFSDSEAEILEVNEKFENCNPSTTNALGYAERSSHKENLVAANTMGSLTVKDINTGVIFKIGTGFNDEQRAEIWKNSANYLSKLVKYKYMTHGEKDKPRHPVFLGFRHLDDR